MMAYLTGFDGRQHPSRMTPDDLERRIIDDAVQGLDTPGPTHNAEAFLWWAYEGYRALARHRYNSDIGAPLDAVFTTISAKVTELVGRPWPG